MTPTTVADIVALVRAAFPDVDRTELRGGDAVGTDAYPALRDARPAFVAALQSPAADVRIAAAYALAFVLEADEQAALDAAVTASELPLERAAMILAAGRLRASIALWRHGEPAYPWNGLGLPEDAAREGSPIVRAAIVLAMLFALPPWLRRVQPEVAFVLDALEPIELGPWGNGDLAHLAHAMRATVFIAAPSEMNHAVDGEVPDDIDGSDDDIDPGDIEDIEARTDIEDVDARVDIEADDSDGDDDPAVPIGERTVDDPYTQDRPVRAAAPRIELAGLHDVDWASLEHAYGAATSVPHMIDALSSPDASDRRWGREALTASINHQGSVYSASGPAATFLVELVARPDADDRAGLLALLAGIAVHDPRWYLFADLEDAASIAFAEVAAGGPVFVRLLADPDPVIRTMAAFVLAFVTPPDGAAAAVKRALAMETDRYVRSSLLLALGYVGRRTNSVADRAAMERYLDDDCMLLAASAAIALAQIDRIACSPRVRAVLARTITDAPPVTGVWPWNEGSVAGFARTVRMHILSIEEMLHEADAAKARDDLESAREYATRAFGLAFRDGVHGVTRPWVSSELDDRQRRILRFLVTISPHHSGAPAPQFPIDALAAHAAGIPLAVEAVRRLVGDAQGALDREIVVGDRTLPAWFAIDDVVGERTPLAPLRAAFAAIAPNERIALIEDALSGPFGLWHSRVPMDFASQSSYQQANDYTSRFIVATAELLADAELVGHAYARTLADTELASDRPRALRCLVAAIVLARHANATGEEPPDIVDRLALTEQAPASTHRIAIRAALDLLAPDRRARLLGDLPLYTYWYYRDPRGEVRRWINERGWDLLELLGPDERAAKILAAWREWQRHRAAGDDANAEPVRGGSTSSLERQPGPDQDFPRERAIAILDACGFAGRTALVEITTSS